MAIFLKDPQAVLDYTIDWNDGYLTTGETISTGTTNSVWAVSSSGITIDSEGQTTTTTTLTLSGGTHGVMYKATNRVKTSGGRTDDRTVYVKIWEPR